MSANKEMYRWDGGCICRRVGPRTLSGGARRAFRRESSFARSGNWRWSAIWYIAVYALDGWIFGPGNGKAGFRVGVGVDHDHLLRAPLFVIGRNLDRSEE